MAQALHEREWLRPKQAAEYLGISLSTLYAWRKKGLVRFYRKGPRVVALRRDELDAMEQAAEVEGAGDRRARAAVRCRALSDELRRKYGITPDSTQVIRAAREARSR